MTNKNKSLPSQPNPYHKDNILDPFGRRTHRAKETTLEQSFVSTDISPLLWKAPVSWYYLIV